jgi:hypothetical protein
MKVVINKCYGGFGVSAECLWELIKSGSESVDAHDLPGYFGANNPKFASSWETQWSEAKARAIKWDDAEMKKIRALVPETIIVDLFGNIFYDTEKMKVYTYPRGGGSKGDPETMKSRCSEDLIRLIETKGSEWASGSHAKLNIVEVPDDANWEISEYDGIEHLAEVHRTWR